MEITKKIIIVFTIISLLGGSFVLWSNHADASWEYVLKEFIIKPLVRSLANALENKIVNKMTALISGVKQKSPSFITNWRNYTLDSMARGNDVFRAELNDTKLCPHFSDNLRKSFGADLVQAEALATANIKDSQGKVVYTNKTTVPGVASFQIISGCTLPTDFNSATFKSDFSKGGGWASWNKLIEPQNNFFGAYIKSLDEAQNQIGIDTQSSINSALAGKGYLGQQLGNANGGSPRGANGSFSGPGGCVGETARTNRCLFMGKTVTPPDLIANIQGTALGAKIARAGFGTELTDVIQGLIGAVVTGLTSGLTNLTGIDFYGAVVNTANKFSEDKITSNDNPEFTTVTSQAQAGCISSCNSKYDICIGSGSSTQTCTPNTGGCNNDLERCKVSGSTTCQADYNACVAGSPQTCTNEPDPGTKLNCEADRNICHNRCNTIP